MSGRRRTLLSGKIHRATVTQADLNYIGSVSIDEDLLDASGISEWEKVAILDVTNGARLETYAIKAPRGSREICINGAAAHLVKPKDVVIILSYVEIEEEFIEMHVPRIVLVNSENKISEIVSSESNF
ncbi:MAG TPA: aspartate 1-decarboxylase [Candidatus Thalassarchaeaceae archaeon]|nr:aspartate 1-decarboxylase [Euryarchaeota archaeon]DAC44101.1 MAG TPA: aspartate 1-decarboxylase [Candidatus Poseidoniales archaeon]HII89890.1 aspartate 1-decarboxylase [Candidatus Thalassarchaeaceae archaeon]